MKHFVLAAILAAAASFPAAAQTPAVIGTWLTEAKTAHVLIAPCPDASRGPLCGTIVKLLEANPGPGPRNRMTVLAGNGRG